MNAKLGHVSRTWTRAARRASRALLLIATSIFAITVLPIIILGLVGHVLSYDATGRHPMEATASIHHHLMHHHPSPNPA